MKYLVDTHVLIWAVMNSSKLPSQARELLSAVDSEFFFSTASIWEIAIKRAKHPDKIPIAAQEALDLFTDAGFRELAISSRHAIVSSELPEIHNDPFDRMLIAQAKTEGMRLLTHDGFMSAYGDFVIGI